MSNNNDSQWITVPTMKKQRVASLPSLTLLVVHDLVAVEIGKMKLNTDDVIHQAVTHTSCKIFYTCLYFVFLGSHISFLIKHSAPGATEIAFFFIPLAIQMRNVFKCA